jgi:hypothetical protein
MKKLFFTLALTGIVGAVSINTASASTFRGDEKKDKKECKKDAKCSSGDKKCCHSKDAKTSSATDKSDTKKTTEQK